MYRSPRQSNIVAGDIDGEGASTAGRGGWWSVVVVVVMVSVRVRAVEVSVIVEVMVLVLV